MKDFFKNIDKKMLKTIGIVLGILIVIIIGLSIGAKLLSNKYKNYSEVETLMSEAAKEYYKDNIDLLPKEIGDTATLNASTLISENYMDSFNNLLKNSNDCSGQIIVTKINTTDYEYVGYLNCGEEYNSVELYRVITSNNNVVTEKDGLYKINNDYIYKGENPNNYVSLGDTLWRILKITKDNEVVLISNTNTDSTYEWDDRYNIEYDSDNGINNFNVSRIRDTLISLYENTSEEDYELILPNEYKSKIVNRIWCIGSRNINSSSSLDDNECKEVTTDPLRYGLITVKEYIDASLDPNCNKPSDESCRNYNYLNKINFSYWTMTKSNENSSQVYYLSSYGVRKTYANYSLFLRPVVYLNKNVMFNSGEGTFNNPYQVK